jgi:hypothetical protein
LVEITPHALSVHPTMPHLFKAGAMGLPTVTTPIIA